VIDGPNPRGETLPFWVEGNGQKALAKPGKAMAFNCAAHEKIAFDLAYELSLPVPAVQLWKRGPDFEELWCCVVMELPNAVTLDVLLPSLSTDKRAPARLAASRALAFELWIGAMDRGPRNMLAYKQGQEIGFACVDFSRAFDRNVAFLADDVLAQSEIGRIAHELGGVVKSETCRVASDIAALSDRRIQSIVSRIPEEFLPEKMAMLIAERLCQRKSKLGEILARHLATHQRATDADTIGKS
jgi:hypothetical protein